jgi:hypothetical protein
MLDKAQQEELGRLESGLVYLFKPGDTRQLRGNVGVMERCECYEGNSQCEAKESALSIA